MPDRDVNVGAVTDVQDRLMLLFHREEALRVSRTAMEQLRTGAASLFSRDSEDREFIDLDSDGAPDIGVADPVDGETTDYTLTLLPSAGAEGLHEFTFTGPTDRYGTVRFYLPARLVFGTPDFILPAGIESIEDNAFEGVTGMTIVDAGHCTSIGQEAFKGCTGLTQILLDRDCEIAADAFSGCGTVYVFAPDGGATMTACDSHDELVFIATE